MISKKNIPHLSNIRDPREKNTPHLTNIRDLKLFSREKFTRKNVKKIRVVHLSKVCQKPPFLYYWQASVVMFGLCREGPIDVKITSTEFGASSRCVRWWARWCDARPDGRLKAHGQSGHFIKCWPSSRSSLAEASRGGCSWPPVQDLMWRPRPQGRLKRRWHLGQTTSVFPDVSSAEVVCLLGHVFLCFARLQGRWNTRWQSGQTRSGLECGSSRFWNMSHDFRCCASLQPRLNFRPQCWQVNLSAKPSVANTPVWTWTEESTTSSVSAGECSR